MVTDIPIINNLRYFNLLKCGKTSLTRLMPYANKNELQPQGTSTILKSLRTQLIIMKKNNTPLSNSNIQEEMCKVIEEESIADANNVTADTFSHVSNTKRENSNTIIKVRN